MPRFNLDFAWVIAIPLPAVRAACDRSASVALDTLSTRDELNEKKILQIRVQKVRLLQVPEYHCML